MSLCRRLCYFPTEAFPFTGLFCLMEGFYAVGAHLNSFSIDFCPLEVGIALGFRSRIIVTSQKNAGCYHSGSLAAIFAFCCHDLLKLPLGRD